MTQLKALSKSTLELASMALNAQIAKMEKYDEGTSGCAMKQEYISALSEVHNALKIDQDAQ